MENWRPATLGRTGRTVGRLGLASSYGADDHCVAMAFDSGVNYFYWGTLRRGPFGKGLRQLARARDRLVITIQSYSRLALLVPWSVELALRSLRMEYADVLLLGLWNKPVSGAILDQANQLRERGLVRFLGLSTHNRAMAGRMAAAGAPEVLHVRYNAIHRGAEHDVFAGLPPSNERPGIVSFTATSWGQLLTPGKLDRGERVPTASDCYRFAMSNPAVDVCMAGPKNTAEFQAGLEALKRGPMDADELEWMRRVGDAKYRSH
jgi:aryl-alcohol dehydrogenase-like predicted oxidoreductase